MSISPFLKDLAERIYQAPLPDCARAEQAPSLDLSFHPLAQRWLESGEDPAFADLLRATRDEGLSSMKVPVLVRHIANLCLVASNGRQRIDNTLRGDHLLSLSGDASPPDYDREHQARKRAFIRQDTPNRIIEHLVRHSRPDEISLALDVGTGNGRDVIALVRHGVKRAIGLDSSPVAVSEARRRIKAQLNGLGKRAEIRQGTLDSFVARDETLRGQVDAVTATSVFHLFPPGQLPDLLSTVRNLLGKKGVLAIQQKTPRSPFNGHGRVRPIGSVCLERGSGYTSRLCADGHPRYFIEPDAFRLALQKAGFKVSFLETETLDYDAEGDPHEFNLAIANFN